MPTLEEQIGADPNLFMHLVALVYKRHDGTEPDRPEWNLDPEARAASASTGYDVLHRLKRLPGTSEDGTVDPQALLQWVRQVRDLATKYGRISSADHAIGEMFICMHLGLWIPIHELYAFLRAQKRRRGTILTVIEGGRARVEPP